MLSTKAVDLTESKQSDLRTLLIAMAVVPTVIILIRAWSRALLPVSPISNINTKFWWDDWTAFVAAALNIAVCGMGLKLVDYGLGLHLHALPPENIEKFLKMLWIIYYIFDTGTAVSKTSALFFYARVFSVNNSRFKYALWVVHAMNAAWLLAILLSVTFMCNPIQRAWQPALPGTCLNTGILWTGSGVTSLIIDVIILVMPLPMLWKLQMKTISKIQIIGVFMCGYLVVVVSIGRLVTIIQAGDQLEQDPTFKVSTPVLWLGSEIAISIISVSLPSIFFLAQRVHRKGFSSLLTTRTHFSETSKTGTDHRFHDVEDDGLISRAHDYGRNSPSSTSTAQPYSFRTKTTAEFGGTNERVENMRQSGIHVMRNIEVV